MPLKHPTAGPVIIHPAYTLNACIALLGIVLVLVGSVMPVVARGGLSTIIMALLFVTLPCLVCGSLVLMQGWLRFRTSIALTETGLQLRIPTWAGGCYFPLRKVHLRWDEIKGVTRQQIVYGPLGMAAVPVDEYTLLTSRGRYTLTKAFCPQVHDVIAMIIGKADLQVEALEGARRFAWWRKPDR